MYPELFTFPGGFTIKTYGFCLMVGFLSAVWLAMRRAARVRVDPDRVLDVSFVALLAGVAGARAFYVIHYWRSDFADHPNRFFAIIDLRQGGLEFLGGLLGATVAVIAYLAIKKLSVRLFLDILAPGAMWGLAFGRLGCFFNACCFGGVCTVPGTEQPSFPWAVRFPYGSAPHVRQWENRMVKLPAELIGATDADLYPMPVPDVQLSMKPEPRDRPLQEFELAKKNYEKAKADGKDAQYLDILKKQLEQAQAAAGAKRNELRSLKLAQRFPSRISPTRETTVTELQELAATHRSLPVHPVQLYAATSALLLSGFLSALFYRRKRHGVVIATMMVLYGVSRTIEETIRVDNPHDVAGLSVSQSISLGLFVIGLATLWVIFKRCPLRSPRADAAAMEPVTSE